MRPTGKEAERDGIRYHPIVFIKRPKSCESKPCTIKQTEARRKERRCLLLYERTEPWWVAFPDVLSLLRLAFWSFTIRWVIEAKKVGTDPPCCWRSIVSRYLDVRTCWWWNGIVFSLPHDVRKWPSWRGTNALVGKEQSPTLSFSAHSLLSILCPMPQHRHDWIALLNLSFFLELFWVWGEEDTPTDILLGSDQQEKTERTWLVSDNPTLLFQQ